MLAAGKFFGVSGKKKGGGKRDEKSVFWLPYMFIEHLKIDSSCCALDGVIGRPPHFWRVLLEVEFELDQWVFKLH